MTTESITIASVLFGGLTVMSGVVLKLWNKVETYQTKIQSELDAVSKQLVDCEKSKFELLKQSISRDN
jgi:hypothetical protein